MATIDFTKEDILMKIAATVTIERKDVVANFVGNLLTGAGGDIAYKVYLILTKDALYIEYIGHCAIGYAPETRKITKILLSDLISFDVSTEGENELMFVKTSKKEYSFSRNNAGDNNLGLAMHNVIRDIVT